METSVSSTMADINKNEDKQPRKIGGWLYLVAIVVIYNPLRLLFTTYIIYVPLLNDKMFKPFISESSNEYIPFWGSLLVGEVIFNLLFAIASFYMAILFFQKKSSFPKWYAFISISYVVFLLIDAYLYILVLSASDSSDTVVFHEIVFNTYELKELSKSLFYCLVWTPYLFLSLRSKETFIR